MSLPLVNDFNSVPGQVYALISFVGPDQPQKTEQMGMMIRGVFGTLDDAQAYAKRLQKEDATFDIYVVDMYKWLLIPPDKSQIDNVQYVDQKLQEIMQGYKDNRRQAAAMFEKRKRDLQATPGPDGTYTDPSDEFSKYYTKPDVPPIPHPSDFFEDLQKEFPDRPVKDLVHLADLKVLDEIQRRRDQESSSVSVAGPSGDSSSEATKEDS